MTSCLNKSVEALTEPCEEAIEEAVKLSLCHVVVA